MDGQTTRTYPLKFVTPFHPGVPTMTDPKERFYRRFREECTDIEENIDKLDTLSHAGGERQACVETILTGISHLNTDVIDAGEYIPAYDIRTYSQAIEALKDRLNEKTNKSGPKSRFQFKKKLTKAQDAPKIPGTPAHGLRHELASGDGSHDSDPAAGSSAIVDEDAQDEKDSLGRLPSFAKNYNEELARVAQSGDRSVHRPSFSEAKNISIDDHEAMHIVLPSSASRATTSGSLTRMRRCIIDMTIPTSSAASGVPFAALSLKGITNSLVVAGHVAGAAHLTNLRDSVVVVAARQVRIHDCRNVDIYLHCASHPIIEDCAGMRFAPLPKEYQSAESPEDKNQWDQVDDFKWLKTEPSPNWSILPTESRVPSEVWQKAVCGSPSLSTDDILRKVGALASPSG